jgi:hypothetical protein
MDGPTQKQYGILLLDKGVDGWVGWRAYRYQIIQELEKPVGKEGGVIWRSISSLWARCADYLSLFPSLSCLFVPCLASLAGFAIFVISGLFSGEL